VTQVTVFSSKGAKVDQLKLGSEFKSKVSRPLLHQAARTFLSQIRQGTASTKTRKEVRGGGTKPWRQKGTGRARAGSIRSPLWRGGGVTFGPKPRDYTLSLPKKAKKAALKAALSSKAEEKRVLVIDKLEFKKPQTKKANEMLQKLEINKATVILTQKEANAQKSLRNISNVRALYVNEINPYYVMDCDTLVFTRQSLDELKEALAK